MSASRLPAFAVLCFGLFAAAGGLRAQPTVPDALAVLNGHTESVEAVAVSPDGKFIATASFDKTVKLWDAATGKEIRTYSGVQGHTGQVLCVAFNAKGDQIATGGADNKVCVWDVPVSFPVKTYATTGAASGVMVAADGKTFAVAGADGVVKVFPLGEEKGAIDLKGPAAVVGLGYLPSGNIWVTAGADKSVRFFNGADGKQTASYTTGTTDITGLAVRPDSQGVVTTSGDGVLRFWQTPPQLTRAFPPLKDAVTAFYATPDGNTLVLATADKAITIGTTANNAVLPGAFPGAKGNIEAVALSPDTATVAAGGADGGLTLWDRQGKVKAEVPAHAGGVTATAFHPSQPVLFTAGADGKLKGWTLPIDTKVPPPKDKKEVKLTKYEIPAHTGKVTAALVNPSTGHVITAGADKLIRVWDLAKPEKAAKEIGPLAAPVTALALSRDNLTLAAGAGKDVQLWTLADGKEVGKLPQPADVLSLSFNADKTKLLIGRADNMAMLAEVATGTVFQAFPHTGPVRGVLAHPATPTVVTASADKSIVISPVTCLRAVPLGAGKPNGVVMSPASERVFTTGPGKDVTSWNTGNGVKEKAFESGGVATAAAVSKDGQKLAVGGADGSIKVYTVADAKLVGSIAAGAPVADLAFQPTNTVLVALLKDKDNSAVAWNVAFVPGQPLPPEFGRQMQSFPHPAAPAGLAFNADNQLFTAGADKQARRFRIASDVPVKTFGHPNLVDCVAFDDTGNVLATGCHDGILRTFDLPKAAPLKTIEAHIVKMPQQVQNPIYAVQWTPDYKQIFTSSYDRTIKLWDAAGGTLVREFKAAPDPVPEPPKKDDKAPPPKKAVELVGHRDQVFSIALSKDGKLLASGSSDKSIKLWDVATAKVIRDFPNPDLKPVFPDEPVPSFPGWVHAVRFSPDGAQLVTVGAAPKGKSYIAVWGVADGKRLSGTERDFGPIHCMALVPDGTKMVIGYAGVPRNKIEPGVMILKVPGR